MSDKYYYEADYGKRFGAYIIDCLILAIVNLISITFISSNQKLFIIGFIILQISNRLYFILLNKFCQRTLGKRIFKLKIINYDDEKINEKLSWKTVILRQLLDILVQIPQTIIPIIIIILLNNWQGYDTYNSSLTAYKESPLGRFLMLISFIISLAEVITMIINDENRKLSDLIAGTVVIDNK